MAGPNYSVVCAHLRAAKLELNRNLPISATAAASEHIRKSLVILSAYERHHKEATPRLLRQTAEEGESFVEAPAAPAAEKTAKRAKK